MTLSLLPRQRIEDEPHFAYDPNLVLYLPLYKLDGASFMSKDAYGHQATVTSALWTPQGRSFDGIDNTITIPAHASLAPTALTVICWIKTSTKTMSFWSGYSAGGANGLGISIDGNGFVEVSIPFVALIVQGAVDVTTGVWVHCAVTKDASGNYALYIDGVADGTGSQVTAPLWADWVLGKAELPYFNGTMGESLGWNRALSLAEILHNYQATKWRFR